MPVLRADYVDEAASRDLGATCEEVREVEVMVGSTQGYSKIHPYRLHFFIFCNFSSLPACLFYCTFSC